MFIVFFGDSLIIRNMNVFRELYYTFVETKHMLSATSCVLVLEIHNGSVAICTHQCN